MPPIRRSPASQRLKGRPTVCHQIRTTPEPAEMSALGFSLYGTLKESLVRPQVLLLFPWVDVPADTVTHARVATPMEPNRLNVVC
jgi:hypothetical protein